MSQATYLRYEVLRTFRNRRFLGFSLGFPLALFYLIAGTNRHAQLGGVSFPLYYMTGMVAWGTMIAVVSTGGRLAGERQVGWIRQMRITPLSARPISRPKSSVATSWRCSAWGCSTSLVPHSACTCLPPCG